MHIYSRNAISRFEMIAGRHGAGPGYAGGVVRGAADHGFPRPLLQGQEEVKGPVAQRFRVSPLDPRVASSYLHRIHFTQIKNFLKDYKHY